MTNVIRPSDEKCVWTLVSNLYWHTGCGDDYAEPKHSAWRFCPLCGRSIAYDR